MGRVRTIGPEYTAIVNELLSEQYFDTTYPYGDNYVYYWNTSRTLNPQKIVHEKRCTDELHKGPPYKEGGPFDCWEYFTDQYTKKAAWTGNLSMYKTVIKGHVPILLPSSRLDWSSLNSFIQANVGDPSGYGTSAWNTFRPTQPKVSLGLSILKLGNLATTLASTAEVFSNLWDDFKDSFSNLSIKEISNAWLAYQFGWRPFVRNVRRFYHTTMNVSLNLEKIRKENGNWTKRGGIVYQTNNSSTEVVNNIQLSPSASGLYKPGVELGNHTFVKTILDEVWFDGSFRFWIPGTPGTPQWNARAVAMLYGLQPSPSLVWRLIPWSWLINWCTDVDDTIDNMSSMLLDGLCAKYAYIMRHYQQHIVMTACSNYYNGTVSVPWIASLDRKSRQAASPFGFGLTRTDFSARQWSILAALGISRLSVI